MLLLVGLVGCSTTPPSYYGEYTRQVQTTDYMPALTERQVVAEQKAGQDNSRDIWAASCLILVE